MKKGLLARLERLEVRPDRRIPPVFRYGWLRSLPADYYGDRHVVIVKREPTKAPNIEWCEFEERPGRGPAVYDTGGMTVYFPYETAPA